MPSHLVPLQPAPSLNIPPSSSIVTVRVINSATLEIRPGVFWRPQLKSGLPPIDSPVFTFLISTFSGKHILFDLGIRADFESSSPSTVKLANSTTTITNPQNIASILDSPSNPTSIRSTDINALIWSHHHFDHTGDPSTLPSSVPLIIGPDAKAHISPGYPTNPSALLLDSDTAGREVRELDFSQDGGSGGQLRMGRFAAIDYFTDGSFYLLDAPGHCPGHLCALARVTADPDPFVFMGANAAHHAGLLRPSPYLPLPKSITLLHTQDVIDGEALRQLYLRQSANEPFFEPSERMFPAMREARKTIEAIQELDAQSNIFVVLAHDASLVGEVEMFPAAINGWVQSGVKERTRWGFVSDFRGLV